MVSRMNRAWLKDGVTIETSGTSGNQSSVTPSCYRFERATALTPSRRGRVDLSMLIRKIVAGDSQ